MGRWESEVVWLYTRLAPLESPAEPALPEELIEAIIQLTGTTRAAVPPTPPWIPRPEPKLSDVPPAQWVYHVAQDKFHAASSIDGRARC